MATAWRSKWLDWQPGDQIIEQTRESELTKLPKPISVSSVSTSCGDSEITSRPRYARPHDPAAWREPLVEWLDSACVLHRRCYCSVSSLHRAYREWEFSHDGVPCDRETFEQLLQERGFLIVGMMVSGLILREDFDGVRIYPEVNRLLN